MSYARDQDRDAKHAAELRPRCFGRYYCGARECQCCNDALSCFGGAPVATKIVDPIVVAVWRYVFSARKGRTSEQIREMLRRRFQKGAFVYRCLNKLKTDGLVVVVANGLRRRYVAR
jgi:hypothetical protein